MIAEMLYREPSGRQARIVKRLALPGYIVHLYKPYGVFARTVSAGRLTRAQAIARRWTSR
jgi:hypothetical protein